MYEAPLTSHQVGAKEAGMPGRTNETLHEKCMELTNQRKNTELSRNCKSLKASKAVQLETHVNRVLGRGALCSRICVTCLPSTSYAPPAMQPPTGGYAV